MEKIGGYMLVVDDDQMNRMLLSFSLEQEGHKVAQAEDGQQAIEMLANESFDVVLLDILMPVMDGYQVLAHIMADGKLRHIPVIMISALDEMESVVRCIEMGAADYLPKPFDPVLLRARVNASLTKKRMDDLELEYIEQVGYVVEAAAEVEAGSFTHGRLDGVAARTDSLGQLARVFQKMAQEVYAREQRLKQEVQQLRIEIDEARKARQVAGIVETEYFQELQKKAHDLRNRSQRDQGTS